MSGESAVQTPCNCGFRSGIHKCMLCSLKERFRNEKGVDKSIVALENKEYEVKMDPNEREVTVTLYHADLDTESLIESFAYAVGYIQSFMLHGFSENISE